MPDIVRMTTEEGVAVVTLADPGRRNALSRQLSDELAAAVRDALDGGSRVASRSPDLVRRTKQTLRATTGYDQAREAAALELDAQQWSVEQPSFEETVKALRAKIGSR